jgi:hypothetical protein
MIPLPERGLGITPLLVVDTVAKRWLQCVHKTMNVRINPLDGSYRELEEKDELVPRKVGNARHRWPG